MLGGSGRQGSHCLMPMPAMPVLPKAMPPPFSHQSSSSSPQPHSTSSSPPPPQGHCRQASPLPITATVPPPPPATNLPAHAKIQSCFKCCYYLRHLITPELSSQRRRATARLNADCRLTRVATPPERRPALPFTRPSKILTMR